MQTEIMISDMETLVLLYDRTSDIMNVNDKNMSLHRRPGALKTYHQLKKCSNNTSNELRRYQSICWKKVLTAMQEFLIGDGKRILQAGNHYGPQFQKYPKHAMN